MESTLESLQESVETGELVKRPDQTIGFNEYTNLLYILEARY